MSKGGTVLIVDDDPVSRALLGRMLEGGGFRVLRASSGETALRAVEDDSTDVILLDICMADMDGYEVCRKIKAREATRDVPIIFISGLQETEAKVRAFQAGGVDYLVKPFEEKEVLARVKTHVELYTIKRNLEQLVDHRTQALANSEARYRVVFEDNPLPAIVYDVDQRAILAVNRAGGNLLGYPSGELVGQPIDGFAAPMHRETLRALGRNPAAHSGEPARRSRLQLCHRDGRSRDVEGIVRYIDYPGHRAQILMLEDISERCEAEERLKKAAMEHQKQLRTFANYDALTGLPNRRLLTERMQQYIDRIQSDGTWMVVCYLDIDNFKEINETQGVELADHLLINIAECLRSCLHDGDMAARLGGDEFALVLLGRNNLIEVDRSLRELQERLGAPFFTDTARIVLTASIGLAIHPQDNSDPDILLRHADQAMLLAKQSGKGCYRCFDPSGQMEIQAQHESLRRMRVALQDGEFLLYYQPKVDLASGKVFGAEALIRWRHPEKGILPPGAFLPAIENDELIVELGEWVIGEALAQMQRWQHEGLVLEVSVNVAAVHLVRPAFMERLQKALSTYPDLGRRLEIEVLETTALEDISHVAQLIESCRKLGVGFSLDDFGTGYSSLTYLRRLPADTLKIDQSFIRTMLVDPGDRAIVAGVIALAKAFGRTVIAEGVETVAHGRTLLHMGCSLMQGYGITRPMPAGNLPAWVAEWPGPAWLEVIESCRDGPVESG